MKKKFKQAIQIGNMLSDTLFKLPCIRGVFKDNPDGGQVKWYLDRNVVIQSCRPFAKAGDWLCEDYQRWWYVLTNEQYQQTINN